MSKTTDEALARLEHKVDFLLKYALRLMGHHLGLTQVGDGSHQCPVCSQVVKYVVDMQDNSVTRQCGCKTGKYAPLDLEQFAPPRAAGGRNVEQGSSRGDATSEGESIAGDRLNPSGARRR